MGKREWSFIQKIEWVMKPLLGARIRRRFLVRLGLRWEVEGRERGRLVVGIDRGVSEVLAGFV